MLPSIDTRDFEALVLGYFIRIDLQYGSYTCFDRGTRIRSHYLIIPVVLGYSNSLQLHWK